MVMAAHGCGKGSDMDKRLTPLMWDLLRRLESRGDRAALLPTYRPHKHSMRILARRGFVTLVSQQPELCAVLTSAGREALASKS